MPRTRKTKMIDERIGYIRTVVFQPKDKYDAAIERLNRLLEKSGEGGEGSSEGFYADKEAPQQDF